MSSLIIDTADIPLADRHAWWSDQMLQVLGVQSSPIGDGGEFSGRLAIADRPALRYVQFNIRNNLVERPRARIRQAEWDSYVIYFELGAGALFEINGWDYATAPGDLLISDGDVPMRTCARSDYHHDTWMIPKRLLDPHLPPMPRPVTLHIPANSGIAALLVAYIQTLGRTIADLPDEQVPMIADHMGRLVALSCGDAAKRHGAAIAAAQLAQAKQYIERHLGSAELNAAGVGAAIGMDPRVLHKMLERDGEGFAALVQRRRLEECRKRLADPALGHLSITDIAFDSGFASLPTFYRAFGKRFEAAPRDLRARRNR